MQLSQNFKLSEFAQSDTALRLGIQNIPSPSIISNLKTTAEGLELVRELLGQAIHITSGYRCIALNRAIGSNDTSAHVLGFAADFRCGQFGTPEQVTKAIRDSGIQYDQLICEGYWTHISFDPKMRQQTLRALFDAKGKATYREFKL